MRLRPTARVCAALGFRVIGRPPGRLGLASCRVCPARRLLSQRVASNAGTRVMLCGGACRLRAVRGTRPLGQADGSDGEHRDQGGGAEQHRSAQATADRLRRAGREAPGASGKRGPTAACACLVPGAASSVVRIGAWGLARRGRLHRVVNRRSAGRPEIRCARDRLDVRVIVGIGRLSHLSAGVGTGPNRDELLGWAHPIARQTNDVLGYPAPRTFRGVLIIRFHGFCRAFPESAVLTTSP
jgi:hypothetical protein